MKIYFKKKLIDLNILCENDTMAIGGEINFPKTLSLPNSRGIEKWNSIAWALLHVRGLSGGLPCL